MSYKTTAVLLIILTVLGGYVYTLPAPEPPKTADRPAHIWNVDLIDIYHIDLTYQGKTIALDWNDEKKEWFFLPESAVQGKADQVRLNGIRLLLSGPASKRQFFQGQVDDLSQFGLTQPTVTAHITLKDGTKYRIRIGDQTANGQSNYVMLNDRPDVWLVDYTWGNEMIRFFREPPVAKDEE